jgi:hypothetical protein
MRRAHPRKRTITKRLPTEYLKSQSAFGSGGSCIGRNRLAAAYSSLIWQIAPDLVRPRDLEASSSLCAPTTESRRCLSGDKPGRREWRVSESHFHRKNRAHPYLAYLSRICPATPHAFENRDALSSVVSESSAAPGATGGHVLPTTRSSMGSSPAPPPCGFLELPLTFGKGTRLGLSH